MKTRSGALLVIAPRPAEDPGQDRGVPLRLDEERWTRPQGVGLGGHGVLRRDGWLVRLQPACQRLARQLGARAAGTATKAMP